jgi:hypothetical protein
MFNSKKIMELECQLETLKEALGQLAEEKESLATENESLRKDSNELFRLRFQTEELEEEIRTLRGRPERPERPKVLVIEDKPAELEKAIAAVESRGWECVAYNPTTGRHYADWMKLVDGCDGVITDMFWNHSNHGEKPCGLLVVVHSQFLGKPVVVCTNAGEYDKERGHHGAELGFIHDGLVMPLKLNFSRPPFGWEEEKDWSKAVRLLANML